MIGKTWLRACLQTLCLLSFVLLVNFLPFESAPTGAFIVLFIVSPTFALAGIEGLPLWPEAVSRFLVYFITYVFSCLLYYIISEYHGSIVDYLLFMVPGYVVLVVLIHLTLVLMARFGGKWE
jgi:hypothetical protein